MDQSCWDSNLTFPWTEIYVVFQFDVYISIVDGQEEHSKAWISYV